MCVCVCSVSSWPQHNNCVCVSGCVHVYIKVLYEVLYLHYVMSFRKILDNLKIGGFELPLSH